MSGSDLVAEKVAKARSLKEEGNAFFKASDWRSALQRYHLAWLNIKGLGDNASSFMPGADAAASSLSAAESADCKELTESIHLNLAACYLRTEQLAKCIKACTVAIQANPTSVKALFRRGQAHLKLRDVDAAERDLKQAAQLAPSDVAIRKELQKVGVEKKKQSAKQAKTFAGFFDKVDLYDDKVAGEPPSAPAKRVRAEGADELGEPVVDTPPEPAAEASNAPNPSADASAPAAAKDGHSDPRAMD